MTLNIKIDEGCKGSDRYIIELTKPSYPAKDSSNRERNYSDEGAADVIRYRADSHMLLAIAREVVRHLSQDRIDKLTEKRLFKIWETEGLSIPWGHRVEINGSTHRLIPPAKKD